MRAGRAPATTSGTVVLTWPKTGAYRTRKSARHSARLSGSTFRSARCPTPAFGLRSTLLKIVMAGRSYLRPRADATSVHGRSLGYAASAMALPLKIGSSSGSLAASMRFLLYFGVLSPKEFENGADGMAVAAPGRGRGARGGIRHGREPGAVVRGQLVDRVRQRSGQLALLRRRARSTSPTSAGFRSRGPIRSAIPAAARSSSAAWPTVAAATDRSSPSTRAPARSCGSART